MRITLEVSDDQLRHIERAFRRRRFDSLEETVTVLAELAVGSWVDWLSGQGRYTSLTEQYTEWIESIYVRILPKDECPTADRLYNSFNVPFGRAQYIARVLSDKTLTRWRQRAIERLRSAMATRLDEVEGWVKKGDGELNAEIRVDKLSYRELKGVCDRLFEQYPDEFVPPEYKLKMGLYCVQIPAVSFRRIYEALER